MRAAIYEYAAMYLRDYIIELKYVLDDETFATIILKLKKDDIDDNY